MKKTRFMLNSGVATLSLFALTLVLGTWIYLVSISAMLKSNIAFNLSVGLLALVCFLCLGLDYELAGWIHITSEAVILCSLLRRPVMLRYTDVQYIGIGTSCGETRDRRNDRFIYTPSRDFWIYLSMDPVPLAQLNNIRRFRLTQRGIRIAYSKEIYRALMAALPPHLKKALQHHQTTLRAYNYHEK